VCRTVKCRLASFPAFQSAIPGGYPVSPVKRRNQFGASTSPVAASTAAAAPITAASRFAVSDTGCCEASAHLKRLSEVWRRCSMLMSTGRDGMAHVPQGHRRAPRQYPAQQSRHGVSKRAQQYGRGDLPFQDSRSAMRGCAQKPRHTDRRLRASCVNKLVAPDSLGVCCVRANTKPLRS